MTWDVTDLGFRMGLSAAGARRARPARRRRSSTSCSPSAGLRVEDVAGWAVHPGGPRILDVVRDELGLAEEQMAASRRVLAEHGNCSSATVLLVLEELADVDGPVVAMAFGPGLTLYARCCCPPDSACPLAAPIGPSLRRTGSSSAGRRPVDMESAPTVRVFLVDDHEVVRRGVAEVLEDDPGITVVGEAGSVAEALARVPAVRPDVVVVDMRLPDGDGAELCRGCASACRGSAAWS